MVSCYDFKSVFNLRMNSKQKEAVKSDFVVVVLLKFNYCNLNSSEEGFWKSDSNQCWG